MFLLIAWLAFVPQEALADASNYCLWMLLVDTHATATRCGKPLDAAAEARYQQLRGAAEAEIVRDAPLRPGMTQEKARAVMADYVAHSMNGGAAFPAYCAGADAPMAIRMLDGFTNKEAAAKFIAGLNAKKDPFDGECL